MVSGSLKPKTFSKLFFYLLPAIKPSNLRLFDVIFGIKGAFFAFFSKTIRWICAKFFSGFRRKHLFITTCIGKQCTRPLMTLWELELFPVFQYDKKSNSK